MKSNNLRKGLILPLVLSGQIVFGQAVLPDTLNGSSNDSLRLEQTIRQVLANYPTVKLSQEALNAADAKISLAKSGWYPDVDFSASYTRLGPVTEFTIPQIGHVQLYPADNYAAAVNYHQNIYDFGKTSRNVDLEKESKKLNELSLDQVKQKLSMAVVNNFFSLAFLQEAIHIKDQELKNLYDHLEFVQKKKETGSATQYELLSTKVRISSVESQKVDLLSSRDVQVSILNNLLGEAANTEHKVKYDLNALAPSLPEDSLVSYAMDHRDEMMMARKKTDLANLRYKVIKAQNNPVFSLFASGGAKNGYFPNLNDLKANYTVGLGFRIPIYDGSRTKFSLQQANSGIASSGFETELTRRTLSNEVVENETRLKAASQKVKQFEMQVEQATEAYNLAMTNFKAGAVTNLDLLDASTSLSESNLMLLKSRIDYLVNIYSLKVALGEKLY